MVTKLDKRIIEAILFAVGKYISEEDITKLMNIDETKTVKKALKEIQKDYETRESPMMVISEHDKWKLTVREEFMPVIQKIIPSTELNKSIMETLAVIAWKVPIKQSDLIDIRSNKAYDHISELVEKDFVTKERHGRTYMIKLTKKFYDYFDVQGKEDLKKIFKDFEGDKVLQKELNEFEKNKKPGQIGALEVYDSVEGLGMEIEEKRADIVPIKKEKKAEDEEQDGEKPEKKDDESKRKEETKSEKNEQPEETKEIEEVIRKKQEINEEMPGLNDMFDEKSPEKMEEKERKTEEKAESNPEQEEQDESEDSQEEVKEEEKKEETTGGIENQKK